MISLLHSTVNELLQKGENRLRYETVGNSQTTSLHIACMNKHYEVLNIY